MRVPFRVLFHNSTFCHPVKSTCQHTAAEHVTGSARCGHFSRLSHCTTTTCRPSLSTVLTPCQTTIYSAALGGPRNAADPQRREGRLAGCCDLRCQTPHSTGRNPRLFPSGIQDGERTRWLPTRGVTATSARSSHARFVAVHQEWFGLWPSPATDPERARCARVRRGCGPAMTGQTR